MKDIALQAALAASTPARTANRNRDAADRDENAQAWQREMERVQAQAWLAHPVVGYSPLATSPAMLATQPVAHAIARIAEAPSRSDAGPPPSGQAGAAPEAPRGRAQPETRDPEMHESAPAAEATAPSEDRETGRMPSPTDASDPRPEGIASNIVSSAGKAHPSGEHRPQLETNVTAHQPAMAPVNAAQPVSRAAPDADAMRQVLAAFGAAIVTIQPAGQMPAPIDAGAMRSDIDVPDATAQSGLAPNQQPMTASDAMPVIPQGPVAIPGTPGKTAPIQRTTAYASARTLAPEPAELRVHAEWSAEGVRLWLGLHASALETAPAVAAQLQTWLAGEGHSLLTIVCNGRPLFDRRPAARPNHSNQQEA